MPTSSEAVRLSVESSLASVQSEGRDQCKHYVIVLSENISRDVVSTSFSADLRRGTYVGDDA